MARTESGGEPGDVATTTLTILDGVIAAQPAAVAVADARGAVSYRELDARASAVAAGLVARGVARGDVVALLLPRGVDAVVAMLGIMRAGAAYLPVDPDQPAARIETMLTDSDARVVITVDDAAAKAHGARAAAFGSLKGDAAAALPVVGPADLAYVIYTSGSTGEPKGVCIEHRTLAAFAREQGAAKRGAVGARHSQYANLSFDAHVWEIWPGLATGASIHVIPDDVRADAEALVRWVAEERITWCFLPTPVGEECLRLAWPAAPSLEVLGLGGDALHGVPAGAYSFRILNVYGPTECTCVATTGLVAPGERTPSIGRPIGGVVMYVLDEQRRPVPAGETGELWVGGALVGRGYLNRPELTAERFVADPFSKVPGARMYGTGDLGRLRASGELECLGRIDHQVKIRGYRVELGEIEVAMARHPSVDIAVVASVDDQVGGKRLVAYVTAKSGEVPSAAALREHVGALVPAYMVPSAFVVLDALPRTANGKIDRRALPRPDVSAFRTAPFVAPRDEREAKIASVIAEVLRVPAVGAHDDFFELGGHSLLAMQVVARLRRELHPAVSVGTLFEARTVEQLARAVAQLGSATSGDARAPMTRDAARGKGSPLSRLQERLWFLEKLEPGSSAYVISVATRLRGDLDLPALERALGEVVRRHEALRTTFEERGSDVRQIVHDATPVKLERRDLKRVPPAERERVLLEQTQRELGSRFDLVKGPLFRAKLVAMEEREHVLLLTMHHIISDGWSVSVLVRELGTLYAAYASGAPTPLAELAFQYVDHTAWERLQVDDAEVVEQLAYWKKSLAGAPPALTLPTDRPRPPIQKHRGAKVAGRISARTTALLRELGLRRGTTMYMTLLAAFSSLLARLSGQDDIVVATPTVNRSGPEAEAMIGFFMNTIALRVATDGNPTFDELLARSRAASLGAYAHQDVPFDRVVVEVNPARDLSRSPIAQACLNVLNLPSTKVELAGLTSEVLRGAVVGSKFDLTLYVEEQGDALELELLYDPDLFDEPRMRRMLGRFERLLDHVATQPSAPVASAALDLDEERARLPDPRAPLPRSTQLPLHRAFDARVAEGAAREAVTDAQRSWTYGELGQRANQLAHLLAARGVRRGDVVAILAERNALTVWGLLAVMKAGAAFVVRDADYPPARLLALLAKAEPAAWLNAVESRPAPPELAKALPVDRGIDLASAAARWSASPKTPPDVATTADDRAYVAFTSGTTGGPKAILGSHGPLAHFASWHASTHGLGPTDRFSALSGLGHDPFLRDALVPLAIGASVVLPPSELRLEPDALASWMATSKITVAHLTPSLGEVLALARGPQVPSLRHAFFGGEPLRGELAASVQKLAPACAVTNFYGATETPQAIAFHPVRADESGPIPIGRGIEGVQLLVLTASGAVAGMDEEGEIVVRTPHLALGYLGPRGDEEARFLTSPFTNDPADRLYRTGDRGRYRLDGSVEVTGRHDDQVKIRGFRVELAEIVGALCARPQVRQAAVVFDEAKKALVAYVVGDVDVTALPRELAAMLPAYMVPRTIVKLEAIPLTPNGKVDRRALPAPEERAAKPTDDEAPDDDVTLRIVAIWKDVLDVEEVGLHDNFFDLGGHSLLATQLAVRLQETFGIEVSVRTIFEAPTVAELSERVVTTLLESASPEDLAAALAAEGEEGAD